MTKYGRWAALAFISLLAACGGGGGGSGSSSSSSAPTSSSSSSSSSSAPASIAPTISAQPASVTHIDGEAASFSVTATGTPAPTYQWRLNNTDITGATSSTYSIASVNLTNNGDDYTVVVSNSAGSVTSSAATLTVTAIATAITTPPANQNKIDGQSAQFSVAATGSATLTYQWQLKPVSGSFADISGANGSSYNLATVVPGNNGEQYRVVVSGPGGTVTSAAATLSVSLIAPSITTQPASTTVLQNAASPSFTVVADGSSPLAYQWQRNGSNISGATSATYSGAATAYPANDGDLFRVIVSNDGAADGAGTDVTSSVATLTITQTIFAPSGLSGVSSVNLVESEAVNFSVTVGGGTAPFTYQWQRKPVSGSFANIPGATNASYAAGAAQSADSGDQFRVIVTNLQGSATSSAATLTVTPQAINLIAGFGGAKGNVDALSGPPTSARFSYPTDTAVDSSGDVYVADFGNQTIRKIAAGGAVTTVAGTAGSAGYVDGTGVNAKFNNPAGVAVNAAGTKVYVADQANNVIREIDVASGAVITIAGTGISGSTDNVDGSLATFNAPVGVTVADSTLYVAEFGSDKIRKITLSGLYPVATVTGTGSSGAANGALNVATFNNPAGVAVDPGATAADTDDILYVTDTSNARIRKVDVTGNAVSTLAGLGTFGGTDGDAATATFGTPRGIVLVANNLYVSDPGTHTIRKIDLVAGGGDPNFVTTFAGTTALVGVVDGTGATARFNSPYGIAANGTTELFVANFSGDVISKITVASAGVDADFAGGTEVRGHADNANGTLATFSYPRGIATDNTGVSFVADSLNNTIRRIAANGAVTTYAGDATQTGANINGDRLTTARFNDPRDVAIGTGGTLYVADRSNDAIRRIDGTTGDVTTIADSSDGVSVPDAIVTIGDVVYVANTGGNNILKIDDTVPASPVVTVLAGTGVAGYADSPAAVQFYGPNGIAVVGTTLYVADGFNFRIRAVDVNTGATTTIAGDGTSGAVDNATGTSAVFGFMGPLASTGTSLYMVDYGNNTVRKISLTAPYAVSTVVGVTGSAGVDTGLLPGGLNGPTGISVAAGATPGVHLRVTDGVEHVILGIILTP